MTQTLRSLWPFARPYRRGLLLGAILALTEVLIKLTEPWPLGWLVDNVLRPATGTKDADGGVIVSIAVATSSLCLIVGMAALVDYWSTRLLSSTGLHLANDVRTATFGHLQKLSLDYHGQHRVGDLTARVTGDVDRTQELFVQVLAVLLPNTLLLGGMFVVMVVLDPTLSALALVVTPLLVLATHRSTVRLKSASRRARKSDGEVASAAAESLSAIGLVQAFTLEPAPTPSAGSARRQQPRRGSRDGPDPGPVQPAGRRDRRGLHCAGARHRLDTCGRGAYAARRAARLSRLPRFAVQAGQGTVQALDDHLAGCRCVRACPRRARHRTGHHRPTRRRVANGSAAISSCAPCASPTAGSLSSTSSA